jgi:hypothetical protein
MEGTDRYDLLIERSKFIAEVECKSLSADAGRQIHRKDFYRFMEAQSPILEAQLALCRPEVVVITLDGRLSSNVMDQVGLRAATRRVIEDRTQLAMSGNGFEVERRDFNTVEFGTVQYGTKEFYEACTAMFGENVHVAGWLSEDQGCLVVMRSKRKDDTSKPMLEGMRKASDQFSGRRPAFVAIQLHGIGAADLMLPHVRRQAAILSHALYRRYGGVHVSATCITGFGAVVARGGELGTPAFAIPNLKPAFPVDPADAPPFLGHISDEAYAAAIGAPLPVPNISFLPILQHDFEDTS